MKNKKKILNKKGFTLIELLIVIGLTGLAVAITSDILLSVTRSYNRTQILSEIEQQSSIITLKLNKELKNSVDILSPSLINTNSNELSFVTQIDGEQKIITYFINNNVLFRQENNSDPIPISSDRGLQGVEVTCEVEDNCFVLNSKNPLVISYNLLFKKPSSFGISNDILVSNTIVIRGSY